MERIWFILYILSTPIAHARQININSCAICLEEYDQENENNNISILRCGHLFHNDCLQR